ncbi:hypothetical protein [Anaerosporobacter sp.]
MNNKKEFTSIENVYEKFKKLSDIEKGYIIGRMDQILVQAEGKKAS